jgi:hypothetical protein
MVGVDDALPGFLRDAEERAQACFAASCVERGAGVFFLAVASEPDRGADLEAYLRLLEDLWGAPGLSPEERASHQERADSFPELQGDEEPPGILAYAFDAVAVMYYAYAYLVSGDSENIRYCSNHMLSFAGYIDDVVSGASNFYEEEIAAQLRDIEMFSANFVTVDLGAVRDRAQMAGRDRTEALRTAFYR